MNLQFLKSIIPDSLLLLIRQIRRPYLAYLQTRRIENSAEFLMRKSFYGQFLKKGDLYFDIGANYGNRIGPIRKLGVKNIIAVEPQLTCCIHLRNTFPDIEVIQKGLGKEDGVKDFYVSDISVLSSFSTEFIARTENDRFRHNTWNKVEQIEIVTLDSLIKKYGVPDFIKVDVEGYELEVFEGLNVKVKLLSFEYTVPELSHNLAPILQKLYSLGEFGFNFSVEESMQFQLNDWLDFPEAMKLIESPAFINTGFGDIYIRYI